MSQSLSPCKSPNLAPRQTLFSKAQRLQTGVIPGGHSNGVYLSVRDAGLALTIDVAGLPYALGRVSSLEGGREVEHPHL